MDKDLLHRLGRWLVAALLCVQAVALAQDQAPARVGRLAALSGDVRLFDAEAQTWVAAIPNRPFVQGERLAVGPVGSVELQVGASALVLDADTELEAMRLDDERLLFVLARGSVGLRQHAAELASQLELATAEAVFQPLRAGLYRIDRRGGGSSGTNWRGLLRATTADAVLTVEPGQRVSILAEAGVPARWSSPASDGFSLAFLRGADAVVAAPAFVSPEMTGVAELERYGSWQQHPEFGWAWSPAVVAPQWAPFRQGQWVWVQPWGWTWVDAAPWGFAPFRYGHWFWWGNRWAWAPGPGRPRPVVVPVFPGTGVRPLPPPQGWMPPRPHYPNRPYPGVVVPEPRPPQPSPREPLVRPVTPPVPVAQTPGPPAAVRPVTPPMPVTPTPSPAAAVRPVTPPVPVAQTPSPAAAVRPVTPPVPVAQTPSQAAAVQPVAPPMPAAQTPSPAAAVRPVTPPVPVAQTPSPAAAVQPVAPPMPVAQTPSPSAAVPAPPTGRVIAPFRPDKDADEAQRKPPRDPRAQRPER